MKTICPTDGEVITVPSKTEKTVKTCFIEGTFPELPASKAHVTGRGEGGSLRVAATRAMSDLMQNRVLRARRLHAAKLTVAFGFKVVDEETKS